MRTPRFAQPQRLRYDGMNRTLTVVALLRTGFEARRMMCQWSRRVSIVVLQTYNAFTRIRSSQITNEHICQPTQSVLGLLRHHWPGQAPSRCHPILYARGVRTNVCVRYQFAPAERLRDGLGEV